MNCMKCGQEIDEGRVFCADCLEEMGNYPVKPGTVVQLPSHKPASVAKKVYVKWHQAPAPEEQLVKVKRRLRAMVVIWLLTLALLAAAVFPYVRDYLKEDVLLPGQNYSTVTSTGDTAESD